MGIIRSFPRITPVAAQCCKVMFLIGGILVSFISLRDTVHVGVAQDVPRGVRGSTCMTHEYKNGKFSTNNFAISGENGITYRSFVNSIHFPGPKQPFLLCFQTQ